MHLVIISGATRPQSKSNTAKVISAFQKGFEEKGNTTAGICLTADSGSGRHRLSRKMTIF